MGATDEHKRQMSRNNFWFWLALLTSFSLMVWFSLAFLRTHLGIHDVSAGMLFVGLGVVAVYAAHNKMLQRNCSSEVRKKPGEWIFLAVFLWGGTMWTVYQLRVVPRFFGIEIEIPEHFYSLLGSMVFIFSGSSLFSFLALNNKNENGKES